MYPQNTFFRLNKLFLIVPLFLFSSVLLFPVISFGQSFTKITTGDIVTEGGNSYSISCGDFDNDGYLDLFVGNFNQNNYLYHNNGDGTFIKITSGIIVNDENKTYGSSWGDYDNDGDLDLFVTNNNNHNNCLYRNEGGATFTKITTGDIVNDGGYSSGSSWGDFDNDGYLDLFVAKNYKKSILYRNNGNGTFTKITSGDIVNDIAHSSGCSWCDFDNDGYLDLFVSNYNQRNFLYRNNGEGNFTKISNGNIVNDISYSRGGSWGDYDNDGDFDLFVTNDQDQNNFLYSNNGDGTFSKIFSGIIVNDGGNSYSSSWGDYDNDGDLDLFVANNGNQNNLLYINGGDGTFTKITTGDIVNDNGYSCSSICGDINNDGYLDLFVANFNQNNFLYLNKGNGNNWINIKCISTKSNAAAIGAKVKVKATINDISVWQMQEIAGQTGFASQNSLNAEFGFGDATIIDSIKIQWPTGINQVLTNIPVNQFLTITEPFIELNVSTAEALPFDTVKVPINVKLPAGFSYSSAQMNIDVSLNDLDFIEIVTEGSITGDAGWSYQVNEVDSGINIWFAGTNELSNEGILCWLKFAVLKDDPGFIPITLESAVFDNDIFFVNLTSGGLHVLVPHYGDVDLNAEIQAYDAALILKYLLDIVGFNRQQMLNADVSLDSTISALDATLILQYGVGIIDTLPYNSNRELFLASGDIEMENSEIKAGQTIEIPLILKNGDNILSFEGKIEFDSRHLSFKDIAWPDLLNNYIIDIKNEDGEIYIAGASISPIKKSDGLFATLQFTINNNFEANETTVTLMRLRWNEDTVLKDVATAKLANVTKIGENELQLPVEYSLSQNYPNPFNPTTTISYSLKQAGPVQLLIYNDIGRVLRTLVNTEQNSGRYSAVWDGKNEKGDLVTSGIYFYSLKVGDSVLFTKKMIMIK